MDPPGYSSSHLHPGTASGPAASHSPSPTPSIHLSPAELNQAPIACDSSSITEDASTSSQQYQPYLSSTLNWGGQEVGSASGDDGNQQGSTTTTASKKQVQQPTTATKIRRRNRMITSCLECRRRKLKCDRLHPCTNCSKFKRHCLFLSPTTDALSRMKLMELKEKMGSLELVLEQDVAARQTGQMNQDDPSHNTNAATSLAPVSGFMPRVVEHTRNDRKPEDSFDLGTLEVLDNLEQDRGDSIPDDERYLRPTPLAVMDAAYDDDADDDTFDIGFKLGKMRMTDRIGGFFRPRIADEISVVLKEPKVSNGVTDTSLNTPVKVPEMKPPRLRDLMPEGQESFFHPGPTYIAPHSDFFFGGGRRTSLADFLPTRTASDRLLEQYWVSVDPVAKILHRPTFERQYREFWSDVSKSLEPPYSLQAVVFAVLFTAVASMQEHLVLSTFGVAQKKLIENFQLGTEMALGKAHFLKTTKTQTLQALVMYMIPMCRNEVSRTHSALVGTAIRLAECMGIHRDPEEYGHGPVETHIRRMIWYQLCFLDLRTSESQGPRQTIRREDYSTKFPLNVNDADFLLHRDSRLTDMPKFTDMTFTRIRFECHELHRLVYVDRMKLENNSISLTRVLGKIEAFRRATYAKYGPLIYVSNPRPIQRAAQLVLSILICRSYTAVLHRYHNSVSVRIPDRLRQIIITACTQLLEDAIELETAPDLQPWAWYSGAFNQYHVAFLILIEVWAYPMRKEADRIWRCLDYVFETPSTPAVPDSAGKNARHQLIMQRDAKARLILEQLRDRMTAYREMRKLRVPISMADTKVLRMTPEAGTSREPSPPQMLDHSSGNGSLQWGPQYTSQPFEESQSVPAPSSQLINPARLSPPRMFSHEQYQLQSQQGRRLSPASQMQQYQHGQPSYQRLQLPPQHSSAIPSTSPSYSPNPGYTPTFQQSGYAPNYSTRIPGRESMDSGTGSEDSGMGRLWFTSGTDNTNAGAGLAPPLNPAPQRPSGISAKLNNNEEDLPMLDIDWNEWDKLFPPDINNGDLNLPPLSPMVGPTDTTASLDNISSLAETTTSNYSTYPYSSS
ncbi:hypothetical protein MGYG_02110 [Nannizzia gypsea CBS 118893]|uniref:C6 finger domain transcription factor nscR n=1 Tax=Arthroderma gypseum (strain ATCC MYA-4604 / CBS 118893) TaxID=535722 RepID=E4UPQ9_ARTGP|nr:hypothetical protein MGYG_02110 [Nannizzia gypsea CBS 118893]EFQ99096.1 hypothetical protein MGYG_02110 [Nannizzia gypsea CBS 118893]